MFEVGIPKTRLYFKNYNGCPRCILLSETCSFVKLPIESGKQQHYNYVSYCLATSLSLWSLLNDPRYEVSEWRWLWQKTLSNCRGTCRGESLINLQTMWNKRAISMEYFIHFKKYLKINVKYLIYFSKNYYECYFDTWNVSYLSSHQVF